MTTYYAITNVNGPISIRIEADSAAEAVEQFREMDAREIIDSPDMDAEDDLDIEGADCDDEEFADALRAHGCTYIQRLGTEPDDLWCLWEAPEETVDVAAGASTEFDETSEESEGDEPDEDALCYYILAHVTVAGETYRVSTMVGAPLADHGSVRASGAGVRPFCTAWTIDASDLQDVPKWLRSTVTEVLLRDSYRLFLAAEERESERAA